MRVSKIPIAIIWAFAVLISFAIEGALFAATIPSDLYGKWCAEAWVEFSPKGYHGSSDSEEYGCDVMDIKAIGDDTWKAVFSCTGEFGTIQTNSIIKLQMLKGLAYLAMADKIIARDAKKAKVPPLSMFSRC